jgi:hypothetical protein
MAGDHVVESNLICRARFEHVYGVQSAPRTHTETPYSYDAVATQRNAAFCSNDQERDAIEALANDLTGGFGKFRTLDIGCGTRLALDLGITESVRHVGIDPARSMLNELFRRHPYLAGVHPTTFAEAVERRMLGGTRFDLVLVLALGGSAFYLSSADLAAISEHSNGRIMLRVYCEGEAPVIGDLTEQQLEAASGAMRLFSAEHHGRIGLAGRFDIVLVSAK